MLLLAPLMFTHSFAEAQLAGDGDAGCQTANMASTYVPIESWVYPAIERLAMAEATFKLLSQGCACGRGWKVTRLVAEAQEQQIDHQNVVDC